MRKYLIPEEGNFYKANLHSHSNISDGALTPEEIKKIYKEQGYSVFAYTDHDVMIPHPELNDGEFLTLNGFEAEITEKDVTPFGGARTCHLCFIARTPDIKGQPCWNTEDARIGNAPNYRDAVIKDERSIGFVREYTSENINELIRICREAGFFITYNHPTWSLEDYPVYTSYHGMHAMEVYNHSSACLGYDEQNAAKYDDILKGGERIFAVASDDNHNKRNDSFGGFVMIKAERLEYTAVTDALFNGSFYASQGPEIKSLYVEDGRLFVETSDATSITATTKIRRATAVFAEEGKSVNSLSFALEDAMEYVRVTVTDKNGKRAWSRAYFIDELA